jgi:anaerobic selenocysteine-containing dehydrogenase
MKLRENDVVDIISNADGIHRVAKGFRIIAYDIPVGCAASYFPETNVLVPIGSVADKSFTPTSKFIVVQLKRCVS